MQKQRNELSGEAERRIPSELPNEIPENPFFATKKRGKFLTHRKFFSTWESFLVSPHYWQVKVFNLRAETEYRKAIDSEDESPYLKKIP